MASAEAVVRQSSGQSAPGKKTLRKTFQHQRQTLLSPRGAGHDSTPRSARRRSISPTPSVASHGNTGSASPASAAQHGGPRFSPRNCGLKPALNLSVLSQQPHSWRGVSSKSAPSKDRKQQYYTLLFGLDSPQDKEQDKASPQVLSPVTPKCFSSGRASPKMLAPPKRRVPLSARSSKEHCMLQGVSPPPLEVPQDNSLPYADASPPPEVASLHVLEEPQSPTEPEVLLEGNSTLLDADATDISDCFGKQPSCSTTPGPLDDDDSDTGDSSSPAADLSSKLQETEDVLQSLRERDDEIIRLREQVRRDAAWKPKESTAPDVCTGSSGRRFLYEENSRLKESISQLQAKLSVQTQAAVPGLVGMPTDGTHDLSPHKAPVENGAAVVVTVTEESCFTAICKELGRCWPQFHEEGCAIVRPSAGLWNSLTPRRLLQALQGQSQQEQLIAVVAGLENRCTRLEQRLDACAAEQHKQLANHLAVACREREELEDELRSERQLWRLEREALFANRRHRDLAQKEAVQRLCSGEAEREAATQATKKNALALHS